MTVCFDESRVIFFRKAQHERNRKKLKDAFDQIKHKSFNLADISKAAGVSKKLIQGSFRYKDLNRQFRNHPNYTYHSKPRRQIESAFEELKSQPFNLTDIQNRLGKRYIYWSKYPNLRQKIVNHPNYKKRKNET